MCVWKCIYRPLPHWYFMVPFLMISMYIIVFRLCESLYVVLFIYIYTFLFYICVVVCSKYVFTYVVLSRESRFCICACVCHYMYIYVFICFCCFLSCLILSCSYYLSLSVYCWILVYVANMLATICLCIRFIIMFVLFSASPPLWLHDIILLFCLDLFLRRLLHWSVLLYLPIIQSIRHSMHLSLIFVAFYVWHFFIILFFVNRFDYVFLYICLFSVLLCVYCLKVCFWVYLIIYIFI